MSARPPVSGPIQTPTIITRPRLVRYTGTGVGLVDHPFPTEHPDPPTGKSPSAAQRGIIHLTERGPTGVNRNANATCAVPARDYSSNPGVRVGNWRESGVARDAKLADLIARKERGELGGERIRRKVAAAESPAHLATQLAYGVPVMLQHVYTLAMLAVDPTDVPMADLEGASQRFNTSPVRVAGLASGEEAPDTVPLSLTYRTGTQPVRRTVFVLERVESWDGEKGRAETGAPVLYGDKLYVKACEVIPGQTLYLHTTHKSTYSFSKHGKQAPATLLPFKSAGSIWQFVTVMKELVFESQGMPVEPGHTVVLNHCITSNFLYADPHVSYRNDFGLEMEVAAKRGTELSSDTKVLIQWVVWVDDPSLIQDVDDIEEWQADKRRKAAVPRTAALP